MFIPYNHKRWMTGDPGVSVRPSNTGNNSATAIDTMQEPIPDEHEIVSAAIADPDDFRIRVYASGAAMNPEDGLIVDRRSRLEIDIINSEQRRRVVKRLIAAGVAIERMPDPTPDGLHLGEELWGIIQEARKEPSRFRILTPPNAPSSAGFVRDLQGMDYLVEDSEKNRELIRLLLAVGVRVDLLTKMKHRRPWWVYWKR